MSDYEEIYIAGTDPNNPDSDGDGLLDGEDDAPNNGDADHDGIPDGVDEYDWEHNTLLAENAGYTNLVLTVVQGMDPPAQNTPRLLMGTPNASVSKFAMLDIGGLKIPAYTGTAIPLGIPYGIFYPFTVSIRGNLPVQLQLSSGASQDPFYLEDPDNVFSSGTSSSTRGRMAFPTLYLVPDSMHPNGCLHDGDTGVSYNVRLHPMPWEENSDHAEIDGFSIQTDRTLWLPAPDSTVQNATGVVSFQTPWLRWGELSAVAAIHWCRGHGYYCLACDIVHTEENSCSHDSDCAAVHSEFESCSCPPILLRTNIDDDNLNETEDRGENLNFLVENEIEPFHPVGTGGCCCEYWQPGENRARIIGISPGMRLWDEQGNQISVGDMVSETIQVEGVTRSLTIGDFTLRYNVLNKDGSTYRTMSRSFTSANALILPDLNDDGIVDSEDFYLRETHRAGNPWTIVRREKPYRLRLKNECPSDATLRVAWTSSSTNMPSFSTVGNPSAETIPANVVVTNAPFAIRNTDEGFLVLPSSTNDHVSLNYSINFNGRHVTLTDTLPIRVVDIEIQNVAVMTNELSQVRYDYSHVSTEIEWELYCFETECVITNSVGGDFDPPDDLPIGTYMISAVFDGIYEDGYDFAYRSSLLYVGSIVFEPQTTVVDVDGHLCNPSCLGVGMSGCFTATVSDNLEELITWTADPALNVDFGGSCTGSTIRATGRFMGDTTLKMEIQDFLGPTPQTVVRVVPTNTIPVNAWIVHDGNGHYASTPEWVEECVDVANVVFYQVGVQFTLESISYTNRADWLRIFQSSNGNWPTSSDVCSSTNGTNGIECYFVDFIENAAGLNTSYGILIGANASSRVLAHEIGHACNLSDMYLNREGVPECVDGTATLVRNPEDWGSENQRGYYPDCLAQNLLVRRNLMYGIDELFCLDISRGDIYALWYEWLNNETTGERTKIWHLSLAPVGWTTHGISSPQHH